MTTSASRFLPVGVLAFLFAGLWCGLLSPPPACPYVFEVEIKSPLPATARISYDRGAGWRDSEAAAQSVIRVDQFYRVRLPLVPGKYKALRFQPTDRPGPIVFRKARLSTFDGHTTRIFSARDFSVADSTVPLIETGDEIRIDAGDAAVPPALSLTFNPPLRLALGFWSNVSLQAPRFATIAGFSFVSLLLLQVGWQRRQGIAATLQRQTRRHPRAALALCAGLASVMSSYPVVFFAKSFVSPAPPLLYDSNPALPSFDDPTLHDTHGADTGAMMWQHFPITVRESRALAHGELPLWNRTNSAGLTLLGQGQSMLGDPLQLLVIATGGASWAFDGKFLLAKALFACGLSWCVWALTRDFAAAAILAFACAFIGFFNYRFNHPAVFSVSYSPWILVAWLRLSLPADGSAFRRGLMGWFLANWMVITSGTVKEAYLLCIALNVTGALFFILQRRPWSDKLRRGAVVAFAALTFVAASTPLWLTFLRSLASAFTAYDVPTVQQIRQEWFIGLFDDLFYREYMPDHSVYQPAANFLLLLGLICACYHTRRLLAHPGLVAFAVMTLVALGCAFQIGTTPWMAAWFVKVPLLRNVYHLGNVFSCIAIVHLAVVAGWGFSAARKPLAEGRLWSLASITIAVISLLLVPYFTMDPPTWAGPHRWNGWDNVSLYQTVVYANVILLPASLVVLLWAASRKLSGAKLHGGGMLCLVLALLVLLARHGLQLTWPAAEQFITAPGNRADMFASSPTIKLLQAKVAAEPSRVIGTGSNLFPGFASVYDLEGINGPDALQNRQFRQLTEAANMMVAPGDWRIELPPAELARWRPILNFLNVGYVVAPVEALLTPLGYHSVARKDFDLFRSENVWPRAFFCDRIETYSTVEELLALIRQHADQSPFAAMQTGDVLPKLTAHGLDSPSPGYVPARNYLLKTNETRFTIDAPGPGVAVLHESWLPEDFQVTLDGQPVPYLRVNHAFKGVVLPGAGTHEISFKYWPRNFGLMVTVGAAGLALFTALCLVLPRLLASPSKAIPI